MRRPWALIVLFAAVCLTDASALQAATPLTPAQVLSYVRIADLHLSPDGRQLACVASSYLWDARPRIRLVDVATGASREITPAEKSERSPQWSPDGRRLAFISNRGGTPQVYALTATGGEPAVLTSSRFGVDSFHWSPDGRSIAYIAPGDAAHKEGAGPRVADREGDLPRLWLIDVESKATRELGKAGFRIDEFQWRNPGQLLVAASDQPPVEEFTDGVYSASASNGTFTLVSQPPQPFDSLLASPDGAAFLVRSTGSGGPSPRDLFLGSFDQAPRNVSAVTGLAVADARWQGPSIVWFLGIDGFYRRIVRLPLSGHATRIDLPYSVAAFDVARDGTLAFVGEDYSHLPEIYLRSKDGRVRQLGEVQQGLREAELGPVKIFRTPNADGLPIEAALVEPPAPHAPRLPLVLLVHGGPGSSFSAGYNWEVAWAQLLATHGYQVLMVNPRGSNGYSEEFLKANRGDWGGGDYRDLMTVLDAVIARGGTDPARLGIGGWSYGGEMSAWAITQTQRFRAAIVGAGVFDQQAEFETERSPQDDEWYFGTPWEHPEVFAHNSPSTYIRNARTPTLILGGEEDLSNPVGQSKGLYRALKHFRVEAELVLYPGEGHSPRTKANNIDMFERILVWYDTHLEAQ
jgi:dipeptidyl aminopeptidase/acylaminoacyl peptidase